MHVTPVAILRVIPSKACAVVYYAFDVGSHMVRIEGLSYSVIHSAQAGVSYGRRKMQHTVHEIWIKIQLNFTKLPVEVSQQKIKVSNTKRNPITCY